MSARSAVPPALVRFAPVAARVLNERGLLLIRGTWTIVLGIVLVLFATGIPPLLAEMHTVCAGSGCAQWQMSPGDPTTLHHLGFSTGTWEFCFVLLDSLLLLGFCTVGAALCWFVPSSRIAMFCAFMLLLEGAGWSQTISAAASNGTFGQWSHQVFHFLNPASLVVFFYLFPSGRFSPRWTRWPAAVCLGSSAIMAFFLPRWMTSDSGGPPLIGFGWTTLLLSAIIAQVYRYRRVSNYTERRQTKWVITGFALATGLFAGLGALFAVYFARESLLPSSVHAVTFMLLAFNSWRFPFLLIPLSIGIAILRHRLFDVDVVINRTLVYGALTAAVVAFYVLVVGYLGALFHTADSVLTSLVATGFIAVLFQPLRERLQGGVNHLMYGERDNPYQALSSLSRRLEATLAPETVLLTIVEAVAQSLKLPYAAITVEERGESVVAATLGVAPTDPLVLPLAYQEELVGHLMLAPRTPGETFGPADRRLLNDLAAHAGMAVYAVRTTADLRRSRERLVTAREEERRRLRGDLHDGLGPTLASLSQRIEVAGTLIPHQPEAAVQLLKELKGQVHATITDIRRLVYGLRPPTLDEYGLVGAIRDHASQHGPINGLRVSVDAPDALPPLPAAVEVAAYRIVVEALTNIIRHAEARLCRITIQLQDAVLLQIIDDGTGLPQAFHAGVGVASMRLRATELGGECTIESGIEGGTCVTARLPLVVE